MKKSSKKKTAVNTKKKQDDPAFLTGEVNKLKDELKIEAALEQIRVNVLKMKKPGDLIRTCGVLFNQLKKLGFLDIRNTQIAIADDEKGSYMNYEYYKHGKKFIGEVLYKSHPFIRQMAVKMRTKKNAFFTVKMTGIRLSNWKKFLKTFFNDPAPRLDATKSLYYYFYSLGPGGLGFCTYSPLSKDEMNVLTRFRNVFDFTYSRYLEMEKVIATAREAEIQLALEMVRARSMSMHKSNELASVASVLFLQLKKLDIPDLRRCLIGIVDETKGILQSWYTSMQGDSSHKIITFQLKGNRVIELRIKNWRKQKPFSIELKGVRLNEFIRDAEDHGFKRNIGEKKPTYMVLNHAPFKYGYLEVASHKLIADQNFQILQRFAKVFEQTYTRFLDLQKAEEQAREAQIEVALERVRARAMAMHTSDDLKDVARELRRQMGSLGLKELETCAIHLYEGSDEFFTSWAALQSPGSKSEITLTETRLPRKGVRSLEKIIDCYNKKKLDYVIANGWKDFQQFSQTLKVHAPEASIVVLKTTRNLQKNEIQSYWSVADFRGGSLLLSSITKPEDAYLKLLRRFANVFDLAYRRFSDLKKAEAQAREAKIEVALERIRARSMAMHNSNELWDVINVVFTEFGKLDFKIDSCWINIHKKDDDGLNTYVAAGGQTYPGLVYQPYIDHPLFNIVKEGKKHPGNVVSKTFDRKIVNRYWGHLFAKGININVSKKRQKYILSTEGLTSVFAFGKYSSMSVHAYRKTHFSDDDKNVVKRFCLTFDQTYTRFLDLQKAEAQAREAEVQLALERVRAKTMAMHKSDELAEVAAVLFQQLNVLGNGPERINIGIVKEDKGIIEYWATEQDGNQINHSFNATIKEPTTIAKVYAGWKENKKSMVVDLKGKELKSWMHYLRKELNMPFKKELLHERRVHTVSFFSHGMLLISTPEPVSRETINLLERFADVFNLYPLPRPAKSRGTGQGSRNSVGFGKSPVSCNGNAFIG